MVPCSRKRLDTERKGGYPNFMDVLKARQLRLALALLGAPALACASSEDGSFSGGPGLSAGNGMGTSGTGATTQVSGDASDSDASVSQGSDSNSNSDSSSASATETGTTTSEPGTTGGPSTGTTTDDSGTTGLDCEDGLGNLCGNPYDLGSLAEGDQALSQTSTILTPGVADWFQVSFPAINRPGGGTPTIRFMQNEGDVFRFDAYTEMPCGGTPVSCGEGGEGGVASNLLEYTYTDDQPDCCAPPDDSMVAWPGKVYIRVYRNDAGNTCDAYQLILTR